MGRQSTTLTDDEKAYLQSLYDEQVKMLQLMLRYYHTAQMSYAAHKCYQGKIARHKDIMKSTHRQLHNKPLT
jgi:hypothetical protein